MYEYTISKTADNRAFKKACDIVEGLVKGLVEEKPIIDVDGSVTKTYKRGGKKIVIYNDYEVDAVYVDSDINLNDVMEKSN